MNEQDKRLALNEAMFREINERLESRLPVSTDGEERLTVICECADADCTDRVLLNLDEYAQVRSDGRQFVITPGHERIDVEEVVLRNDRFEIVRKVGRAGEIAELLDPD